MSTSGRKIAARREEEGQLGEAMRKLPSARWRLFVEFYLLEKPGHGAQTRAARRAGFGSQNSTSQSMALIVWRLMRDDRIIAAIAEESRKLLRSGAPEAVKALQNMIRDSSHKDHAKAVAIALDRCDPITTKHLIDVTHRHLTLDDEAVEALRTMRAMKSTREQLVDFFGEAGLARYENILAQEATVIEGETVEEVTHHD